MNEHTFREFIDKVEDIGCALKWLGNGDAATNLGAIEAHGIQIEKAGQAIADAISDLADAIRDRNYGGRVPVIDEQKAAEINARADAKLAKLRARKE